ncbi:hypothetical protein ACN47E_003472 [Coniothyrium glycines]
MDSTSRQPRKWTSAEDEKLREEVEAQLVDGDVRDWCRIAGQLPGRTNKDCRKRWHNSVAGGLKKGQWSKSEDELLSGGVEQHGHRWTLVASCVGSRSADQCAKRWQQSLDPDLDRSEWRESEDRLLLDATQRLGRHWKDIQRENFPGRSKNDIKNRYTVLVRRYRNQGITLPSAGSSPSESSTPAHLSSYQEDDDYFTPAQTRYNGFLAAPSHSRSRSRNSWSSMDNDTYATWSTSQEYTMPMAIQGPSTYETPTPLPNYHASSTRSLSLSVPPATSTLDWTTATLPRSSNPMYTRSPDSIDYMADPTFYGYNQYQNSQQPMMNYNPAYTASTTPAPHALHTTTPSRPHRRSQTSGEQQAYIDTLSGVYHDPIYPHPPSYY